MPKNDIELLELALAEYKEGKELVSKGKNTIAEANKDIATVITPIKSGKSDITNEVMKYCITNFGPNYQKAMLNISVINEKLMNGKKGDYVLVLAHDYKSPLELELGILLPFLNTPLKGGVSESTVDYFFGKLNKNNIVLSKDGIAFSTGTHLYFDTLLKKTYHDFPRKFMNNVITGQIEEEGNICLPNEQRHILHLNEPVKDGSKTLKLDVLVGNEAEQRLKHDLTYKGAYRGCYDWVLSSLDKLNKEYAKK